MSKIRRCNLVALLPFVWGISQAQEPADPADEPGIMEQSVPVADEPAPASENATNPGGPSTDEEPEADKLSREYDRFSSLLAEQNFDAADIAAKRVIEMSIRIYGPVSHETAKALNNLGYVQNSTGQYDAAIQNFTSAIEIIETLEDRLNSSLINPLRGLGAAQLGDGRPDLAARTFDRATHITHVNDGPHNIEQVEILEALAEANVRQGELEAARDILDRIHILNVRHFADNTLGLLPSLMRRASWQHRAGYYNDERATYRRAIRIIEDSAGDDDYRLIEPLVKLGQSYYYYEPLANGVGSPAGSASSGESYFRRAEKIAESSEDLSWFDKATTKLALADYYLARESFSRAKRLYDEVWSELSGNESSLEMRSELLESLEPIWQEPLPSHTAAAARTKDRMDGGIQKGSVEVRYVVDQRGRPRIREIRTKPMEFTDMERMVERELKRRRYRPLVIDGAPTRSGMQTFVHEFRYRTSELEERRNENAEDEQSTARN